MLETAETALLVVSVMKVHRHIENNRLQTLSTGEQVYSSRLMIRFDGYYNNCQNKSIKSQQSKNWK